MSAPVPVSDEAIRAFVRSYPSRFRLASVEQLWFLDLTGIAAYTQAQSA